EIRSEFLHRSDILHRSACGKMPDYKLGSFFCLIAKATRIDRDEHFDRVIGHDFFMPARRIVRVQSIDCKGFVQSADITERQQSMVELKIIGILITRAHERRDLANGFRPEHHSGADERVPDVEQPTNQSGTGGSRFSITSKLALLKNMSSGRDEHN